MKKLFLFILMTSLLVTACNSYGDKYMANDKSEVYYKDGATADDAKKLGDFLLKNNYFDSVSEKSVQLTRTVDTFNVKFVVDKEKATKDQNVEFLFTIMGAAISSEVFSGKPVKVILADAYMKGFKEIPAYNSGASTTDTTTAPVTDSTGN